MATTILVIEDDDAILELYTLLLQGEGYAVCAYRLFSEEVTKIAQLDPALVIVDLRMGGCNAGLTLIQEMRSYRPTAHIPIVVCSAAVKDLEEHADMLAQKGIPIVHKPFNVDELLELIKTKLAAAVG